MANYKKISGQAVKCYDSDPPTASPSVWEGQLYYNTGDGQFKYQTLGVGSWSSGGSLNTAGYYRAYNGTQTASMVVGGEPGTLTAVEQYNGASWSEMTENGTAKAIAGGAGTATAGLFFGGKSPGSDALAETEYWNGSSWA